MRERLHPDENFGVGFHSVRTSDYDRLGYGVNYVFERLGMRRRLRMVVHEDRTVVERIMTPEQAARVAERLEVGPDGNLHDPRTKSGLLGVLQAVGLTK